MSVQSVRRLDLYDFFSVLLPGIGSLLGLYPLFPRDFSIGSAGAILPILAGGYVIGRVVHSAAVRVEEWREIEGHRDLFVKEVRSAEMLTSETLDRFYHCCTKQFQTGLPDNREELTEKQGSTLYSTVRSHIYIDSRGRSQSFQAISAFYRSAWFVVGALSVFYILYGVFPTTELTLLGITIPPVTLPYPTKIRALSIPSPFFTLGGIVALTGSYTTLRDAKVKHRKLFVQYLISDLISLYSDK